MDILERFHLALSYLEKSEAELAGWERIRDTDDFDHSQYDLVKSRYERHLKQATELTETIRRGQSGSIPDLEDEVRGIERKQKKLLEAISGGKIKIKEANRENRAITKELGRYEEILANARAISEAESTADLGGQFDLSFEEFMVKLDIVDEELAAVEKKPREFSTTNVVVLVLIGFGVWAGWMYYDGLGKASWRTEVTDHRQYIRIRCTNTGDKSIRVHVPWPDGVTTSDIPPKVQRVTFGILLYVKEKGKTAYQLMPESSGVWEVNGEPYESGVPFILRSGERMDIVLDVLELRKLGLRLDAVKVSYTRYGGRNLGGHELIVQ